MNMLRFKLLGKSLETECKTDCRNVTKGKATTNIKLRNKNSCIFAGNENNHY